MERKCPSENQLGLNSVPESSFFLNVKIASEIELAQKTNFGEFSSNNRSRKSGIVIL